MHLSIKTSFSTRRLDGAWQYGIAKGALKMMQKKRENAQVFTRISARLGIHEDTLLNLRKAGLGGVWLVNWNIYRQHQRHQMQLSYVANSCPKSRKGVFISANNRTS
jgi:hypothetical protein